MIKEEIVDDLKELIEHIVEEIVDHPDDVKVNLVPASYRLLVELHTNDDDVGQVIGQGGHVVIGIRSILSAFGGKNRIQTSMDYVTERKKSGGRRAHQGR